MSHILRSTGPAADQAVFRLVYFPIGGRAAAPRYAAYLGGLPFEDQLLPRAQFKELKQGDKLRWTGVPEIHFLDDKKQVVSVSGQSNAILRYIGTVAPNKLYPDDPRQGLIVDEIVDAVEDVGNMLGPSIHEHDKDKKLAMRKELVENPMKLHYFFKRFEARLQENEERLSDDSKTDEEKKGYLVGDSLTVADLKLYTGVKLFGTGFYDGIPDDVLDKYPRILAFRKKLAANKKIQDFDEKFKANQEALKSGKSKDGIFFYPKC